MYLVVYDNVCWNVDSHDMFFESKTLEDTGDLVENTIEIKCCSISNKSSSFLKNINQRHSHSWITRVAIRGSPVLPFFLYSRFPKPIDVEKQESCCLGYYFTYIQSIRVSYVF